MTRALVNQMLAVLESTTYNGPNMGRAITAARDYLATEPSGERAELIAKLKGHDEWVDTLTRGKSLMIKAADMLEADAQQAKENGNDQSIR